jgi:hypothetical protein
MATMGQTQSNPAGSIADRKVDHFKLSELLLDPNNPRFGGLGEKADQAKIVEFITKQFGVEDVLASLATNGYFQSEPLVARRTKDKKLIVVEGNRRLAACLILAEDPRAKEVSGLRPSSVSHGWSPNTQVPVLVFEESEQSSLLPYLGVRHIVGSQPWDSFAKARWIDIVVSSGQMTLQDIESAIGDTNRTITRMLDGYRFITQLIDAGHFRPSDSHRRGKGSNTDFPFSWVYTLLDYSQVRDYLGLAPRTKAEKKPIPARSLTAATKSMVYMFGDKEDLPSIKNSRQIADLADALSDPVKRKMLEQGMSIEQIIERSQKPSDRLATLLLQSETALRTANVVLAEVKLTPKAAEPFVSTANGIRNLASTLFKGLQEAAFPSDSDAN